MKKIKKKKKKKYTNRQNWVGKVICWELCKKVKFYHTTKLYTYKPKSILENVNQKIIRDFKIQIDLEFQNLVIIYKKEERERERERGRTYHVVDFAVQGVHSESKSKKF